MKWIYRVIFLFLMCFKKHRKKWRYARNWRMSKYRYAKNFVGKI